MTDSKKSSSRPFLSAEEEEFQTATTPRAHGAEYKLAVIDKEFLFRDELRPVRLQLELLRPELVLRDFNIDETIVFFGSARTAASDVAKEKLQKAQAALKKDPNDESLQFALKQAENISQQSQYLDEATNLAYKVSTESNYVVVTGGGPGFMAAANKGAASANKPSIALGVVLPHEQVPNEYVTPELTFQFHYFAVRKMHFLMRAKALIAFPGGYGTLDELFETLMLVQTEKIERIPLLLFNEKYWREIINFDALLEHGVVSKSDLDIFQFVETADQAWDIIKAFYAGE